jgi:hypothetical protein
MRKKSDIANQHMLKLNLRIFKEDKLPAVGLPSSNKRTYNLLTSAATVTEVKPKTEEQISAQQLVVEGRDNLRVFAISQSCLLPGYNIKPAFAICCIHKFQDLVVRVCHVSKVL